jgi:hypothetical protein
LCILDVVACSMVNTVCIPLRYLKKAFAFCVWSRAVSSALGGG